MAFSVIDTNVLVSALLSQKNDAATVQILGKMIEGEITPIYSAAIMREYREVLFREKFTFPKNMLDNLLSGIEEIGIEVKPAPSGITLPDMDDVPFYEAVLERNTSGAYLVTGNIKHFPQEPFIVTPRQMLDIVLGDFRFG
ncbi:MAG: putative toxin-antitoxin system toxin component, PIN family [Actinomycetaceae bacterium]|nr:putative toxin-antitoxin system toxin component, PIN family [Actinomycetaceae bacterium]